eukprot:2166953-Rhodomonas_salina.2
MALQVGRKPPRRVQGPALDTADPPRPPSAYVGLHARYDMPGADTVSMVLGARDAMPGTDLAHGGPRE